MCDETLGTASGEKLASAMVAAVDAAAAKYRGRANGHKTVSIVGVRNVDMPIGHDAICQAVARVLERNLVDSANVTVLEREHLEEVRRERALTPDAPANALLASLVTIQLEFEQAGAKAFKATAILVDPAGQKRRVTATINDDWSAGSVKPLESGILAELHAAPPARKPDGKADAMRLLVESNFERDAGRTERAIACVEAALALAPDDPTVMYDALRSLVKLRYLSLLAGKPSPEVIEEATAYLLRELDLAVKWQEYEGSHGGYKVSITEIHGGGRIEVFLGNYLAQLTGARRGLNLPPNASYEAAVRRFRHLTLDILATQSLPHWTGDNFDAEYVETYGYAVEVAPLCFSNSKEWTDYVIDHARRVMQVVERRGPLSGRFGKSSIDHIMLLGAVTEANVLWPDRYWALTAADLGRLEELFQSMTRHSSPSIQIFGQSSLVWLDMQRHRLDAAGMARRARRCSILPKKIQDRALQGGDPEHAACYEAALNVVDISPGHEVRFELLDELLQLMLARGELCSEVVQMAVNVCYAYPYGHYNFLLTPSHGEIADDGEDDSHLPEIPQVLRRLSSLAASPKVRVIEGRENDVAEMLNFKLAQIAREHGDVPAAPKVQGVTARQLFSIGQGNNQWEPDADLLSRPVIGRDEIYVLELVRSVPGNAPNRLDLLKIGLDGQAVRRISTLELPSRPTNSDWLKTAGTVWGRKQCPLRCPQISGGCLYCSLTDRGGIAVFPLDGGAPRMIARGFGEGRPIDIYDEIVVLDKRIFALTLGLPTYIQWYDPDHGGWQVIASSRRLEKKNAVGLRPELVVRHVLRPISRPPAGRVCQGRTARPGRRGGKRLPIQSQGPADFFDESLFAWNWICRLGRSRRFGSTVVRLRRRDRSIRHEGGPLERGLPPGRKQVSALRGTSRPLRGHARATPKSVRRMLWRTAGYGRFVPWRSCAGRCRIPGISGNRNGQGYLCRCRRVFPHARVSSPTARLAVGPIQRRLVSPTSPATRPAPCQSGGQAQSGHAQSAKA